MEKYGTSNRALLEGLLQEESQLMMNLQEAMNSPEKTASNGQQYNLIESRLTSVRSRIAEIENKTSNGIK